MLAFLLPLATTLVSPAYAVSPTGAFWATAGVSAGTGTVMFVPGAYAYGAAEQALHPPDCGEFPDCEGYGFGLLVRSVILGGTATYGLSAAAGGALTHGLLVKHGTGKVLALGGATALLSTGLTLGSLAADADLGPGLMSLGILGNVVGVPLVVGFASRNEVRPASEEAPTEQALAPALTGIGVAPMKDGARVSVSLRF